MATCRRCGGEVVSVGRRAWCIRPYADGGCGAFYVQRGRDWVESEAR